MKKIKFGINKNFDAIIHNGILKVVCYGGTGFARFFSTDDEAEQTFCLMQHMNMTESQVIDFCKGPEWYFYNYYDGTINIGAFKEPTVNCSWKLPDDIDGSCGPGITQRRNIELDDIDRVITEDGRVHIVMKDGKETIFLNDPEGTFIQTWDKFLLNKKK